MMRVLFGERRKLFLGVVHLMPLPGSPRWQGDFDALVARARQEAATLQEGGVHGIIVENFNDAPYAKGRVEAHTVASMTLAIASVVKAVGVPVGINVLRNDIKSALAMAMVTGAAFVRANTHYGVMVSDEGIIEGEAYETTRYRRHHCPDVKILADVLVKHAIPLGDQDIALVAEDTVNRGLADAVIVSGPLTGLAADVEEVTRVKQAVPDTPVLVGSGVTTANALPFLQAADGAIVGTSLKVDGKVGNAVELARVRELAAVFRELG